MPTYKSAVLKDVGLRIDPIAYRAIKQLALDMGDVSAAQLIRDVIYLWLGYRIDPKDPVFSRFGEVPGIVELFPGYIPMIDIFGKKK